MINAGQNPFRIRSCHHDTEAYESEGTREEMEIMRAEEITVTNLFGIFDHSIPLNKDNHITIIHGPNGFGKSTILKLLDGLLKSRYYDIRTTPFDEFCVAFENGAYIRVTKSHASENNNAVCISYSLGKEDIKFEPNLTVEPESLPFPLDAVEDIIPELERIGSKRWLCIPTGEIYSLQDVIERYSDIIPTQIMSIEEPDDFKKLKDSVRAYIISTQRLSHYHSVLRHIRARHALNYPYTQAVALYSSELAEAIETNLAESASLSQSLDRTFPTRLIQQPSVKELTEEEIHKELSSLEKRRSELRHVGLLDKEKDMEIPVPSQIDSTKRSVFSVYIEDIKKKLGVFDEMSSKIKLFQEIVNSRFMYKEMSVSKEKGFVFTDSNGNLLSPTSLSSGEQHKIVVLYELLFKVNPGSIILIDEPEISLHVDWQISFLPELEQITQLTSLDILMATHSPDIINERWDLTVELKGRVR